MKTKNETRTLFLFSALIEQSLNLLSNLSNKIDILYIRKMQIWYTRLAYSIDLSWTTEVKIYLCKTESIIRFFHRFEPFSRGVL